jgi:hypothetical protein
MLPPEEASLFFSKASSHDLYLRGEVLKTLAYVSAVLDRQVAAMSSESVDDGRLAYYYGDEADKTPACHPSPAHDFLRHFPDLEVPVLKEHMENYTKAMQDVQYPCFHSYLHGYPQTGKSVILNWLVIFAGLNGNPVFSFDQITETLTVYHPDGSIAAVEIPSRDTNDVELNSIIQTMFYSQKWKKTPIVFWNPRVSEEGPLPKYKCWGPSFVASNTHTIPDSSRSAYYHNILPCSEKEMVNIISQTHFRSDVSRMYHLTGGIMVYYRDLLLMPQFTAEMENWMREMQEGDGECGNDKGAVSVFLAAVEKIEALTIEKQMTDADIKADLELLRMYVPSDAAAVPSSAYEIVMEVTERVRRHGRLILDSATDADLDTIVQCVIGTMTIEELQTRHEAYRNKFQYVMYRHNYNVRTTLGISTRHRDGFLRARDFAVNNLDMDVIGYVVPQDKYEFMQKCVPGSGKGTVRLATPHIESLLTKIADADDQEFLQFLQTGYGDKNSPTGIRPQSEPLYW